MCACLVQGPTWWCGDAYKNVTADSDWPSQAVTIHNLIAALADPATCLNTSLARDTVTWLNGTQTWVPGGIMNTWMVFQVQYYDMPRLPGTRIESPDTLGRKCWAFAYLRQFWDPVALSHALSAADLNMDNFTRAYSNAVPFTMTLCERVMANCFVNSTYSPSRNGTCPGKILLFEVAGFERENLKRGNIVKYPFPP